MKAVGDPQIQFWVHGSGPCLGSPSPVRTEKEIQIERNVESEPARINPLPQPDARTFPPGPTPFRGF